MENKPLPFRFSRFVANLQPSPTLSLNKRAKELGAQGKNIVNFSVGEPDYAPPIQVVESARQALKDGLTTYGPPGGSLKFKDLIRKKFKSDNGLDFARDEITVGIGAKELLFHSMLTLLRENDEAILFAPYWVSYKDQIMAAGGVPKILPLPENPKKDGYIDIPKLKEAINDRTKLIILNSPNNPAGYTLTKENFQEIADVIAPHPIWVISDEIYEYMNFGGAHVSFLNAVPQMRSRTIIINGLSKAFAMTGFRVGYAAGPKKAIGYIKGLGDHSSTCIPPFIEEAAITAMELGFPVMHEKISALRERRDFMMALINEKIKLPYIEPKGAFYLFLDLRPVLAKSKLYAPSDSGGFCAWLLDEAHLAMVPGEAFGSPGYARLCYSTSRSVIEDGVNRLVKALENIK